MRSWMACMVAALVMLPAAPARAEFKGCYERVYDAKYLRKNKKQKIIRMRFQIGVGQGTDGPVELLDRVDATLRGKSIYRGGLVECQPKGDELACAIEGDSGTFTVTDRGKNSLRITNESFMRFGAGEGDTIRADKNNREFRLFRVGKGACP